MDCEKTHDCPLPERFETAIQSITTSAREHAERLVVVEQQLKGVSETLTRLVDALDGGGGYSGQLARHDEAIHSIRSELKSIRSHHLHASEQADRRWTLAVRSILGMAVAIALSLIGFILSGIMQ